MCLLMRLKIRQSKRTPAILRQVQFKSFFSPQALLSEWHFSQQWPQYFALSLSHSEVVTQSNRTIVNVCLGIHTRSEHHVIDIILTVVDNNSVVFHCLHCKYFTFWPELEPWHYETAADRHNCSRGFDLWTRLSANDNQFSEQQLHFPVTFFAPLISWQKFFNFFVLEEIVWALSWVLRKLY